MSEEARKPVESLKERTPGTLEELLDVSPTALLRTIYAGLENSPILWFNPDFNQACEMVVSAGERYISLNPPDVEVELPDEDPVQRAVELLSARQEARLFDDPKYSLATVLVWCQILDRDSASMLRPVVGELMWNLYSADRDNMREALCYGYHKVFYSETAKYLMVAYGGNIKQGFTWSNEDRHDISRFLYGALKAGFDASKIGKDLKVSKEWVSNHAANYEATIKNKKTGGSENP